MDTTINGKAIDAPICGSITDEIADGLESHINECHQAVENAISTMERVFATPEEYKEADKQFATNSYIARFLGHVLSTIRVIGNNDVKTAENTLRFHAHSLRVKASIGDADDFAAARQTVVTILEGYVEKYFEA